MFEDKGLGDQTIAVRAGQIRTSQQEHSEAIFPTSSFVFESAAQAAARFSGDEPGNIYARFTNPTVAMFEQRIAALEGAEAAVATASGMAAINAACMGFMSAGDQIICSRSVFGTTSILLENFLSKFGVEVTFVDLVDQGQWKAAIGPRTRLLFIETPSNPLCEVADIAYLASLTKQSTHPKGALLIVDNCFCTPVLQKPLDLGADIVMHSATKYLDGQGRVLGGVLAGKQEHIDEVRSFLRSSGATMSPFNAWVFVKGLETLSIRMAAHSKNAAQVADWLSAHPKVKQVFFAGSPDHPQAELITLQQKGSGGVLSFLVEGGQKEAWQVIDSVEFISITANLGDVKSTITHPATTTHGRLSDEAKLASGILPNLVRVSVGLEDVQDIIQDLDRGLSKI